MAWQGSVVTVVTKSEFAVNVVPGSVDLLSETFAASCVPCGTCGGGASILCVLATFAALKTAVVAMLEGKVDDTTMRVFTGGLVCALVDVSVVYESSAFGFWPIFFNSFATEVFGPVVEPLPMFAAAQVAYFTCDAVATAVFRVSVDNGTGGDKAVGCADVPDVNTGCTNSSLVAE
jgi:hypothetical protein